jgi:hypothetical protein
MSTIHVLYDGNNRDFDFSDVINPETAAQVGIPVGATSSNITEAQMKTAVARHMDISRDLLETYTVAFEKNGNVTVRPEATFGK